MADETGGGSQFNTKPRTTLGYCWHRKIAWRVKPGNELAVAQEEYRAMLEYVIELDSVMRPRRVVVDRSTQRRF